MTDDLDTLGALDLHTLGRDTAARRRLSAYALALPASVRPTSSALGALLGVAGDTVRADWARADVRDLARSSCAAGLSALLLAAARGYLVATCRAALAGDHGAGAALLPWLEAFGATASVLEPLPGDAVPGDLDALEVPGVDLFTTGDARAALSEALEGLSLPG